MYDIAGEITPGYRGGSRNFASQASMDGLDDEDDDDDNEGVVEMRARPVKGSATGMTGSGPKATTPSSSIIAATANGYNDPLYLPYFHIYWYRNNDNGIEEFSQKWWWI